MSKAWLLLPMLTALGLGGCRLEPCVSSSHCCPSCDEGVVREASCGCEADETDVRLCPRRSACAIAHYVGAGPAQCCASCDTASFYQQPGTSCRAGERYFHECPIESVCFQAYRAALAGARFFPFELVNVSAAGLLTDVWGSSDGQRWLVGTTGRVLHLQQTLWSSVDIGTAEDLTGIWGSSASDVWIVGRSGLIAHFNGQQWSRPTSNVNGALLDIWGSSASDIWAVGQGGTLAHFDGRIWQVVLAPLTADLTGIWGRSADDIWAVGDAGTILHYDGGQWLPQISPTDEDLRTVAGTAASTWIAGLRGTLLRYHPDGWQIVDAGTDEHLAAIATDERGGAWAVGRRGVILNYDGSSWAHTTFFRSDLLGDLLGSWAGAAEVWAVGVGGLVVRYRR